MGMVGIEMSCCHRCRWFSNWLSSIWNPSKFCRRGHYFNIKTLKLGDFIDAQGYTGTVKRLPFFHYAEHT
jgi:hypothetical protein